MYIRPKPLEFMRVKDRVVFGTFCKRDVNHILRIIPILQIIDGISLIDRNKFQQVI